MILPGGLGLLAGENLLIVQLYGLGPLVHVGEQALGIPPHHVVSQSPAWAMGRSMRYVYWFIQESWPLAYRHIM